MEKIKNKILICDGEEGVRESLKLILGDRYDLILTDSGEQCLQCLDNDKSIGLVLLGIKMPKINGLEALKAVKEKRPDLNVMAIAGYKSTGTACGASPPGAAGCLGKPFKSDEILETVGQHMSR